jgi:hypothetical protein
MEDSISSYLERAFGYGDDDDDDVEDDDDDAAAVSDASSDVKLTEQQLDAIAKKISERLELDARAEFKSKAGIVKAEKKDVIKSVLEGDRRKRMDVRDVSDLIFFISLHCRFPFIVRKHSRSIVPSKSIPTPPPQTEFVVPCFIPPDPTFFRSHMTFTRQSRWSWKSSERRSTTLPRR